MAKNPLVSILLCTYNGEKFLAEQLESIANQSYQYWKLIISDDGSTDGTLAIIDSFHKKWGADRLEIKCGPKLEFASNFLSIACDQNIQSEYYAFSDQDDVWMPDKLAKSVEYLNNNSDQKTPTVYCGRTLLVDENLSPIGYSPLFTLPRSFRNAIVQSIAGGNTMVFNHAAKLLLEAAGMQKVISHDWWLYQICKGAGGDVYYDPSPTILYRQHAGCMIGSNVSFKAKIERIRYVMNGRFKEWNNKNFEALTNVRHLFTKENQEILELFGKFRSAHLKDRVRLLEVCGLYRQTWQGTLSLWLATIANKI